MMMIKSQSKSSDFNIKNLGRCNILSSLKLNLHERDKEFQFISDNTRILYNVEKNSKREETRSFEKAGPREKVYFDHSKARAAIVTCGGLCPGINNVIRTLVMQLYHNYGVRHIHGIRYGFQGFIPSYGHEILELTPESVQNIHYLGGSILSSSRGEQDFGEIVDCLERLDIHMLFCIGGDGSLRGAHAISEVINKRKLKISVLGIPKTIDNDIPYCEKSFGFETAFSKAVEAVSSAHSEAYGNNYGIVIIKLMGRDSGFIAANTSLACPDVNFVLIPEVPFSLEGEFGLLRCLERFMVEKKIQKKHPHSVIVTSEGVGQDLMGNTGEEMDASGNIRYKDIGIYLKKKIEHYFMNKIPVNIKIIEPSYLIRSLPANPHDSIFCYHLADNAVHAMMAGKTDMMIGYLNGHFTHVPLEAVVREKKQIDPHGDFWRQVLFSTGQPREMFVQP